MADAHATRTHSTNALYCETLEDRQRLLKSLPEENQNVIVRLFELVYTLSKHSAVTKMDLNNLAMVRFPRTHARTRTHHRTRAIAH